MRSLFLNSWVVANLLLAGAATAAQQAPNPAPVPPSVRNAPALPRTARPIARNLNVVAQTTEASTNHPLVWDSLIKEYKAKPGEITNQFKFAVTNRGATEVSILAMRPSCGCTIAKLPGNPWKLAPGASGESEVTINFAGKQGLVTKQIFVDTSHGPQTLTIQVDVPVVQNMSRDRNMQMALADRQAVFKNDCASCHVTPTLGKAGHELYVAACGICHDSAHRAAMVPDLTRLQKPTDAAYWTQWISEGKTNSLMPGFATKFGGPLSDEQIKSLVEHLVAKGPPRSTTAAVLPAKAIPLAPASFRQ